MIKYFDHIKHAGLLMKNQMQITKMELIILGKQRGVTNPARGFRKTEISKE